MQIGPRIRIGGTLGKIGNKAKKFVQKAASNPLVQGGLGLLTGGATIPLLVGAGGGLLKEHAGIGDVLKGGAQGFAAGGAGKLVRSGFGALANAGSAAAPSAVPTAGAGPTNPLALKPIAAGAGAPPSVLTPAAEAASTAAPKLGFARSALNFVKENPTAAAMGLSAVGDLATAGAENRINEAQADLLEQRSDETAYDFEQRKRREEAMRGLWTPLGTAIGSSYDKVARNPYTMGA